MITATLLSVFFVPAFYVLVSRVFPPSARQERFYRHETENLNVRAPQEDR
jgi:hypothetical protein